LIAGISHPLGGLDHLLAMLAVGLWAAQQQGAARWVLPCTFVGTLLMGGPGFEGLNLPALERDCRVRAGAGPGRGAGGAPAVERGGGCNSAVRAVLWRGPWPRTAGHVEPWTYAAGFVVATAALHAAGYAVVRVLPQQHRWSTGGCGFGGDGVWLLAG
jgi:urease accessory protein